MNRLKELHKANIPLKEAQYFMRSQRLIYINEHIHSFRWWR